MQVPARLDLTPLRAPPRCADEPLLPEEAPAAQVSPADVVPDEQIVQQLLSMGFAENGCRRACVSAARRLNTIENSRHVGSLERRG